MYSIRIWVGYFDLPMLIKLIAELESITDFNVHRRREGFLVDIYSDDETVEALLMMISALRRGDPNTFIGITYMKDYGDWCAKCYSQESDILETLKLLRKAEEAGTEEEEEESENDG